MDKQFIELTLTADIIQYTTIYWAQIDCECHSTHQYAMNYKQFIYLTFTIYIIQFCETQWCLSVKTRLYNTPPPYFILWNAVTSLGENKVI